MSKAEKDQGALLRALRALAQKVARVAVMSGVMKIMREKKSPFNEK